MQENCWMNRAGERDLGRGQKRQMKLEVDFKKKKKTLKINLYGIGKIDKYTSYLIIVNQ